MVAGVRPWHLGRSIPEKRMNVLDKIVDEKKREIARLPDRPLAAGDLRDALLERGERRDFLAALQSPKTGSIALIAEVKKASPSAGGVCQDTVPGRGARGNTTPRA